MASNIVPPPPFLTTKNLQRTPIRTLVPDDQLIKPVGEKSALSICAYIKNVICPYFNIPSNVVTKEPWEAYVRICSENINRFATNVLYQRRKSMKSAMELACSVRNRDDKTHEAHKKEAELLRKENMLLRKEMAKLDERNKELEDGLAKTDERNKELEDGLAKTNERNKELEDGLAKTVDNFKNEMDSLKAKHDIETKECETDYTRFVENLIKSHRKEIDDLRNEMKTMQNVHRTFIESYVEASLDVLRKKNFDGPTL